MRRMLFVAVLAVSGMAFSGCAHAHAVGDATPPTVLPQEALSARPAHARSGHAWKSPVVSPMGYSFYNAADWQRLRRMSTGTQPIP